MKRKKILSCNIPLVALLLIVLLFSSTAYADEPVTKEKERENEKEKEKVKVEPLVMVINYPYQIWSTSPTKIHVTLFKPDFTPAKDAVVKINGKELGKANEHGVFIFEFTPGSNKSHKLFAELKENGKIYQVSKGFTANSRTVSYKSDTPYVYTDRGVYNPGQNIV